MHVESHKKFGNMTSVDDASKGTCCGDTSLIQRLEKIRKLGAGAQGEVWLCRDHASGLPSHVYKEIRCTSPEEATKTYQRSVRLMSLNHPHIIEYLAVQRHPKEHVVKIAMKFYHEGDLSNAIRVVKGKFEQSYVCSIGLQLAGALEFLHGNAPPIIHGDIKPENVLFYNQQNQVLLMDLDASKEVYNLSGSTQCSVGTRDWMAPEAANEGRSITASDIWSLGLLLWVMTTLPDFPMLPCDASNGEPKLLNAECWTDQELLNKVGHEMKRKGLTMGLCRLVAKMLSHDPSRRPNALVVQEALQTVLVDLLGG